MPLRSLAAVATAACLSLAPPALAAPGDLDPSFGDDGISRTALPWNPATLADIDAGPGGTIAGVGSSPSNELPEAAFVARWTADGDPDPAFNGGVHSINFPGAAPNDFRDASGRAVVALPGGGILAGARYRTGSSRNGFLAAIGPNGMRDEGFGSSAGVEAGDWPRSDGVTGLARLADGRIVAGATNYGVGDANFRLRRYSAAGHPDETFGDQGTASIGFFAGGPQDWLEDLDAHGAANGVVASGYATVERLEYFDRHAFAVARLRENGSLDPDFGEAGRALVDFAGLDARAYSAAVMPDGRIVLAGSTVRTGYDDVQWAVARLEADGDLDPTFGTGGRTLLTLPGEATGVAVDAAGRVLLAGPSGDRFTVARLTGAGVLDTTFGSAGVVKPVDGASASADVVAIGDAVVAGGWSTVEHAKIPTLVRLAGGGVTTTAGGDDSGTGGGDQGGSGSGSGGASTGSGSPSGGPVSGSADSTSGIASRTTITGPVRGLSLRLLDRRPRRGALRARVTWAPGSRGAAEIRVHATRRGRRVLVASLRFTIQGGSGAVLRVPLTVTGRRIFDAVRRNGIVRVRATLRVSPRLP